MRHFDLHCDTLSRCRNLKESLLHSEGAISVDRGLIFDQWGQALAVVIDDDTRGVKAYREFLAQAEVLQKAMAESDSIVPYDKDSIRDGVCNAMLTVENGAALGGKLERIEEFAQMGVKIFGLVWNGENELAGGVHSEQGLTDFGRKAVRELEARRIIIDVSHLNSLGFWDLCEVAERPFIATHSNCFEICPNRRNLDDLQIQEIIRRGGLIGINFFPVFVNGESDTTFQELRAHIRRIIALGGSGSGVDTAVILRPQPSHQLMDTRIDELLAKPLAP